MKTNIAIEKFAQHLYTEFNIGQIYYGYNPVSKTYLVKVEKEDVFVDEDFLTEIFDFTHSQSEAGEWVMFVSPSDPICFDDYQPVIREYANTNSFVDANSCLSQLLGAGIEWSEVSLSQSSLDSSLEEFTNEMFDYAIAA